MSLRTEKIKFQDFHQRLDILIDFSVLSPPKEGKESDTGEGNQVTSKHEKIILLENALLEVIGEKRFYERIQRKPLKNIIKRVLGIRDAHAVNGWVDVLEDSKKIIPEHLFEFDLENEQIKIKPYEYRKSTPETVYYLNKAEIIKAQESRQFDKISKMPTHTKAKPLSRYDILVNPKNDSLVSSEPKKDRCPTQGRNTTHEQQSGLFGNQEHNVIKTHKHDS